MDRGARRATVHRAAELDTTAWLNHQVWKSNVIYPQFHSGDSVSTGGFLPSQYGMQWWDGTQLASWLLGKHRTWAPSPHQAAGLTWIRDHTALEVSSLSFLLILHCIGKPHFIVLCRYCIFFFSLQIEGLWWPCVEQAYQCHVPNSTTFKLRSVHLKKNALAHLIDCNINVTFICTRKWKNSCDLLYWEIYCHGLEPN